MSRSTILALALSCALACAAYAQQEATPPAASATPADTGAAAQPTPSAQPAQSSQPTPSAQPMPPSQPQPSAAPAAKPAAPASTTPSLSAVPMTEPVLTLKGACKPKPGTTTPPTGCVSSLTRAQFEKLTTALTPPDRPAMPNDVKRNFATQYAKLLTFADAARQMGLENDPRVQQIFQFARNQILTETLNQHITEKNAHPSEAQIEKYYKDNSKKYVEADLQRIVIPRAVNAPDKPKPTEAEEKAYAEEIRQKWVAGGDPEKLQKEASEHAGLTNPGPDVSVGQRRPGTLPEAHESVFAMKPGEVSQLFSDPASFYVYKLVSERQVPLSEAKNQISQTLARQMTIDDIQKIQNSVTPVLNDAYFGPAKPPVLPTTIIQPKRTVPGAGAPGAAAPPPAAQPEAPNAGTPPPANPQTPPK